MIKLIISALIALMNLSLFEEKVPNDHGEREMLVRTYNVSGNITTSSSYCGGAAPDPKMLEDLQARYPYSGLKLYFRLGEKNNLSYPIVDSATTDAEGNYSVRLPHGTYVLLHREHLDSALLKQYGGISGGNTYVDMECMQTWWENGIQKLVVTEDTSGIDFHYGKPCFLPARIPCLSYMGPWPP